MTNTMIIFYDENGRYLVVNDVGLDKAKAFEKLLDCLGASAGLFTIDELTKAFKKDEVSD